MSYSIKRAAKALLRKGLSVRQDGPILELQSAHSHAGPPIEVLLAPGHPLDARAAQQLVDFASTRHPAGGRVVRAFATPDLHPGSLVPVGCVVATTTDLVIPAAIGTDINCGMRLHVADISVNQLMAKRDDWLEPLKGDFLLGTRDLPMTTAQVRAMLEGGPLAWCEALRDDPLGLLASSDRQQLEAELERSYGLGSADGDASLAPSTMLPSDRSSIRDSFLGTIGGGNHFVELQTVAEVVDRKRAFNWGIRPGQVAVMAHSGSRGVGVAIGRRWIERARELWPKEIRQPTNGIFSLHGEMAERYLTAMNTAANYAAVNRLLLLEIVRHRFRQVFGESLAMPLVFDVPHNIIAREHGMFVHRKGATPACAEQPVLIPGSMGHASYLMVGHGNDRYLRSASHGAGRKLSRGKMHQLAKRGGELGLDAVECITLKQERVIQEAPAAYKDIDEVVDVQASVGIASPVARLQPIMTFKA